MWMQELEVSFVRNHATPGALKEFPIRDLVLGSNEELHPDLLGAMSGTGTHRRCSGVFARR